MPLHFMQGSVKQVINVKLNSKQTSAINRAIANSTAFDFVFLYVRRCKSFAVVFNFGRRDDENPHDNLKVIQELR